MAAIGVGKFLPALRFSYSSAYWCRGGHCSRCYAIFSPQYKEPIADKEEIKKLIQEQPEEELLAIKVKPASSSQTCSIFYHPDMEKFINYSMSKGKKVVSREVVSNALTRVKHIQLRAYNRETDEEKKKSILINPLEVFLLAVKNVTPMLWYIKIKKSGSWYKVPVGIPADKAKKRAMKWIAEASNEKPKKVPYEVQLASELVDAAQYKGKAIGKKIEMHKMCEGNRGYIHYWWT